MGSLLSVMLNGTPARKITGPLWGSTIAALMLFSGSAVGAGFEPTQQQLDVEVGDFVGIVDGSSLVRRREDSIHGSALKFDHDLGVSITPLPELKATYWIDRLNAIQVQFRYFPLIGSSRLAAPATFNGDTIAPGQTLNTDGTDWFTMGVYYERSLTELLEGYSADLPEAIKGVDLRAKIGLEFTYLDFKLNRGHPVLLSGNLDARGRWHDQELPIPTIGLEARRWLDDHFAVDFGAEGNWVNKWNSLRTQGGTVYLSQAGAVVHLRAVYSDPSLIPFQPFLGFSYLYFKQAETSRVIGNLVRIQMYGPEIGLSYSF